MAPRRKNVKKNRITASKLLASKGESFNDVEVFNIFDKKLITL